MRRTRVAAIGGLLVALAGSAERARAQDAALLLGRGERTLLVVVKGDSVRARMGAGIVVPRASGWWRVGVDIPSIDYPELRARAYPLWRADSIRNDSLQRWAAAHPDTAAPATEPPAASDSEPTMNMRGEELGHAACFGHVVWAVPLGSWPELPGTDCAEGAEAAGEYELRFVGPNLVTMYGGITTDYSYNFTRGTLVATLDSVAQHPLTTIGGQGYAEDEPDPAPALGVALHDPAWSREAARCGIEYNRSLREDADDSTDFDYVGSWIRRTPGRWRYERYSANTSYAGRGHEESCLVRIPVPARITGWDRLTVPWPAIRRRVPHAMDAFTSPNCAVAIVLDARTLHVFRLVKGALGKELGRIALPTQDVAETTMSQWATAVAASRWEQELAAVLPDAVTVSPVGEGKR